MRDLPASWYPDPSAPGYERWWDGGTWGIRRPGPGAAAAAAREEAARQTAAREAAQTAGRLGGTQAPPQPGQPGQPAYPGYAPPPTYGPPTYGLPAYGPPGYGPQGYPPQGYGPQGYRPGKPTTTPDGVALAGPGRRLAARLLDWMLQGVVVGMLGNSLLQTVVDDYVAYFHDLQRAAAAGGGQDAVPDLYGRPGFVSAYLGYLGLVLAVSAVYEIAFVGLRGATPGKLALGLEVRPWAVDERPGIWRAVQRWATTSVAAVVVPLYSFIDALWLLWDGRRQCLHDKWPTTVVVRRYRSGVPR